MSSATSNKCHCLNIPIANSYTCTKFYFNLIQEEAESAMKREKDMQKQFSELNTDHETLRRKNTTLLQERVC